MRMLYVDQFSDLGGGQQCFLDLLDPLEERGWEVVAAFPGNGPLIGKLERCGLRTDRISCTPYRSGKKGVADYVRFGHDLSRQGMEIAALCATGKFDLVYVNGPRVLPGVLLGTRRDMPLLFHVHNHLQPDWMVQLIGKALGRRDSTVVACCESVCKSLRLFLPERRMQVVPNGTRAIRFRMRDQAGEKVIRLGLVGRIEQGKGQLLFLQCVQQLLAAFPRLETVLCGGPGRDSSYCERVISSARNLPVRMLPWCEDVASVMHELDLLIVPSEMEGLPRVVLEAFSSGLPVVAFPVGGIPEAIEDGITGYLARERTADGLRKRIIEVLRSGIQERQQVVLRAYVKWKDCYALAQYQEQMLDAIEMAAFGRVMQRLLR